MSASDGTETQKEDQATENIDSSSRHRAIRGPEQAANVTVVAGPALGRRFVVDDEPVVVGRGKGTDVRIEDSGVSREHFQLVPDGMNVEVEDLDSSNGTFVNGEPIEGKCRLEEGDSIAIGLNSLFRISWFDTSETFDEALERQVKQIEADEQKLRAELAAARDVQQSLLPPKQQEFRELGVEALYYPSDELSGDFFDFVFVDPWLYAYVIDVTSHGVASAQVTYLLRGLFTQLLQSEALELNVLMTELQNKYREYEVDYDAAYHVCRIHSQTGMVDYMRASVLPGLVNTKSGMQLVDAPPSSALSSLDKGAPEFPEPVQFQLQPDESFILCTDGCYEFQDTEGRQFGKRRLVKLLSRVGPSGWAETLKGSLVRAHGSREFSDDVTAVRLRRRTSEDSMAELKQTTRTTSFPSLDDS